MVRHNCSDALLFDLIKRDQELFDHQTITPWAVKTKFSEFSSLYREEKITHEKSELIFVIFRQLLVDIVEEKIDEMLNDSTKNCICQSFELLEINELFG